MKKIIFSLLTLLIVEFILRANFAPKTISIENESLTYKGTMNITTQVSEEESKRIQLYIFVMKDAFEKENGGREFIAVDKGTLEGLEDQSKEEVLKGLKNLAKNIYWFEDVKDNNELFVYGSNGMLSHTINGTLLSVNLERYKENEAIIEATSWFGNLGAVMPRYYAIYKDGKWELKILAFGVA